MKEKFLESDRLMQQDLQETKNACDEECEKSVDGFQIQMKKSDDCKEHRLVKKWYFVKCPM